MRCWWTGRIPVLHKINDMVAFLLEPNAYHMAFCILSCIIQAAKQVLFWEM